jgi:hypothetical protein
MAKKPPADVRAYLARIGSKGGKLAAAKMTPEQRSARAKAAVTAREAKRRDRDASKA